MKDYPTAYISDDERWKAVRDRDENADGHFCYVVLTTGTYSKPSCAARTPRRKNITFFAQAHQADAAGYRPCGRCLPHQPDLTQRHADAVIAACRFIDESEPTPSLHDLADAANFSRFHFHRVFKALTAITPHEYLEASRAARVRQELVRASSVSDAIYSSGYASNGRFYAVSQDILGMTPTSFRAGGRGALIRYVVTDCWLGPVLVAMTDKGVCSMLHDDDAAALPRRLAGLFGQATIAGADRSLGALMTAALRRAELPAAGRALLPRDLQAVAFQHRVTRELRSACCSPAAPAA